MNQPPESWNTSAAWAIRRLAIVALAGALMGLVVGGIGGRLAMSLLAANTPEAKGVLSDDGFVMGQVTMSGTLNLLFVGTFLGVLGGAIYLAVRWLRIGPAWFQYVSVAAGAGVAVGAVIVRDGTDFTLLHPVRLAIALFVAIPAAYALGLQWLVERWLRPESAMMSTKNVLVYVPALAVALAFPLAIALALGWIATEYGRRSDDPRMPKVAYALRWVGWLALTAIFVIALADLVQDIKTLA